MSSPDQRHATRVLGLDIRPHRAGYICVEGNDQLIDFGTVRFGSIRKGRNRIKGLIRLLRPAVIIMRQIAQGTGRDRWQTHALQMTAEELGRNAEFTSVQLSDKQFRDFFRAGGASTKEQIAAFVAKQYPVLTSYLPPRRRLWQPEHPNMHIFDAASLVIAFLDSSKH